MSLSKGRGVEGLVAWFLSRKPLKFWKGIDKQIKVWYDVPNTEKGNPSVNSTLLSNTMIISLVLIGLLVIIEELMVVGRRSN
jgi:hypothetical protein